ncbi:MAG: phosphohydrolase [Candidatus Levybacteria bacterium]|nr:phosphohydrolase [Candidatus Levybacteria bacterium]
MTKEEALQLLSQNVKNPNLVKHMLSTEAVMKALYLRLNPQPNTETLNDWAMVGLLHDLDYELCKDHPEKHGLTSRDMLSGKLDPTLIYAIVAHNYKFTKAEPKSLMDWSISCCDELTGLIIASTLISPDKKLATVTPDFVFNRFKEKSFAKGANRDQIKMCEEKLQIPLNEFITIGLSAMQKIAPDLGL